MAKPLTTFIIFALFSGLTAPAHAGFVKLNSYAHSQSLELVGSADLARLSRLLASRGLVPLPGPDGRGRLSIAAMRYRLAGGLFRYSEFWVAAQARRPGLDDPRPGYAFLNVVTDNTLVRLGGWLAGLGYDGSAAIRMAATTDGDRSFDVDTADHPLFRFAADSSRALSSDERRLDALAFAGKGLASFTLEGRATSRDFDPDTDTAAFAPGSALERLAAGLGFNPLTWSVVDDARGEQYIFVGDRAD